MKMYVKYYNYEKLTHAHISVTVIVHYSVFGIAYSIIERVNPRKIPPRILTNFRVPTLSLN